MNSLVFIFSWHSPQTSPALVIGSNLCLPTCLWQESQSPTATGPCTNFSFPILAWHWPVIQDSFAAAVCLPWAETPSWIPYGRNAKVNAVNITRNRSFFTIREASPFTQDSKLG